MSILDPMPASVSGVFPAAADYNISHGLSNYETAGGYLSNARHAAASALQRDALGGNTFGIMGANVLGGLNEVAGLAKGGWNEIKEKFGGPEHKFGETWRQTKEDLAANLYGSLYGKSTGAQDVYSNIINQLSTSSGDGIKGWLENIMEKEAEESTLPNTLTLNQLKNILMNQKIQQQKRKIGMPQHLTHTPPSSPIQQVQQNIQTYGNRDRPNEGMNTPGGGKGQSPTGGDVAGTPFVRGGRASYFDGGLLSLWPR